MTAAHDIDWTALLAERLTATHPDVLRELLTTVLHTLMGAEADALWGGIRSAQRRADESAQRLSASPIRYPHRVIGSGNPQAAARLVFPGLAAGTPRPCRHAFRLHTVGSWKAAIRRGYVPGANGYRVALPAPDPQLTAELRAAIDDFHSAAHLCLAGIAGAQTNYHSEFVADMFVADRQGMTAA